MPEPEMKHVLRSNSFLGENFPSVRGKRFSGVTSHRFSPKFLASVRMPHIKAELSPFWDKHFSVICRLNPDIDRGSAREKIKCWSQTQRLFQYSVESHRTCQIIRVIDIHVFHLRIDL